MKGRNRLAVLITGVLAATLTVSASTASREPSIVQPLPQDNFHPIHLIASSPETQTDEQELALAPRRIARPSAAPVSTVPKSRPPTRQALEPKASTTHHQLVGLATWYAWHPGQAAAGPALRSALGARWRGRVVSVCVAARCVQVRLTDWCACRPSTRLIDLDVRSFAALGPTWRGLLPVEVRW